MVQQNQTSICTINYYTISQIIYIAKVLLRSAFPLQMPAFVMLAQMICTRAGFCWQPFFLYLFALLPVQNALGECVYVLYVHATYSTFSDNDCFALKFNQISRLVFCVKVDQKYLQHQQCVTVYCFHVIEKKK